MARSQKRLPNYSKIYMRAIYSCFPQSCEHTNKQTHRQTRDRKQYLTENNTSPAILAVISRYVQSIHVSGAISADRSSLFLWPSLSAPFPLSGPRARSAHAPPAHRSAPLKLTLGPLRSVFRSAHMLCICELAPEILIRVTS